MSGRSRASRSSWVWILGAVVLLLVLLLALAGGSDDEPSERAAASPTAAPTRTATPTPDPADEARAEADRLLVALRYTAAVRLLEGAGLDGEATPVRRTGARALYRRARRAFDQWRMRTARRLATEARRLRRTSATTALVAAAGEEIARAEAAEREQRRLARIARDQRTCSSSEKATVREDGGVPAGCATYAADLEARRAERAEEEEQGETSGSGSGCEPGYDPCVPAYPPDVNCPEVDGPITVTGSDPHGLDRDSDGVACES